MGPMSPIRLTRPLRNLKSSNPKFHAFAPCNNTEREPLRYV